MSDTSWDRDDAIYSSLGDGTERHLTPQNFSVNGYIPDMRAHVYGASYLGDFFEDVEANLGAQEAALADMSAPKKRKVASGLSHFPTQTENEFSGYLPGDYAVDSFIVQKRKTTSSEGRHHSADLGKAPTKRRGRPAGSTDTKKRKQRSDIGQVRGSYKHRILE